MGPETAEQDFEVGNGSEGEDDSDGMGVEDGVGRQDGKDTAGEVEEHLGDGRLAQPAQGERGEGYTELDGGEEFIDGVLELERGARAGTA
jgi:hypothetical protein